MTANTRHTRKGQASPIPAQAEQKKRDNRAKNAGDLGHPCCCCLVVAMLSYSLAKRRTRWHRIDQPRRDMIPFRWRLGPEVVRMLEPMRESPGRRDASAKVCCGRA